MPSALRCPESGIASATPTQMHSSTNVTAGPAAATFSSSPADWGSRRICESPPKNHRSMPAIGIPSLRAASACPSSCMTSEAKYPSAPATAIAVAVLWDPPRTEWKYSDR